jgi:hypothetical protein
MGMKYMRRVLRLIGVATFVLTLLGGGWIWSSAFQPPAVNLLTLPQELIDVASPKGQELLYKSHFKANYQTLSNNFETQSRPAYCGVASSVIVLNALHGAERKLTQSTFFDESASKVRNSLQVTFEGMTLTNLGNLLRSHGADASVFYASDNSLATFRSVAQENLSIAGNYLLVNYQRSELGQKEAGHISPVAAYEPETDRFLVLDVASYKYPPVWVPAESLWRAMNTIDSDSGRTRGYVVIREGKH